MEQKKKKQHYVPQFYLRSWDISEKNKIYVYDKVIEQKRISNIRDVASENYFYDVDSWGDWAAAQSRPSYLGSIMDIEGVAYDGVYYYVRYAEYDKADYEANGASIDGIEAVEHEAVLQLKEENGDEYWSVFYIDAGHVPE